MNYLSGQLNNVYINDVVERNGIYNQVELGVLLEVVCLNSRTPLCQKWTCL